MTASGISNPQKHLTFLGLSRNPFPLAPDNTDFYISQHNDMVIETLTQGILSRKGFMLLTGEIGLGKTTLSRRVIQLLDEQHIETALILQSFYQEENLLRAINNDFGIPIPENEDNFSGLMTSLNNFLLEKNQNGINCAIIIDDAQNLSIKSLELIRMISSLEADREKLVQILLVGQPELMNKLNSYDLRQLKSRVTINQKPLALKKTEIGKYIQFKLNMAGDRGKIIFKKNTLQKLYQLTEGNLRKINIFMDKALGYAAMDNSFVIKAKYIKKANKELSFDFPEYKDSRLTPGLVFFLLLLIVIGIGAGITVYFYTFERHNAITANTTPQAILDEQTSSKIIQQEKITSTLSKEATPLMPQMRSITSPNQLNPQLTINHQENQAIKDFLFAYGLHSFSKQFHQALNHKDFTNISAVILKQTGYQLIIMSFLPNLAREKFDILSSSNDNGPKKRYYLFWKPKITIKKFYIDYQGKEIHTLQENMRDNYFYNSAVNGIVGQKIIKRVKDIQRLYNLPITGFPDPETIFLLMNKDKE